MKRKISLFLFSIICILIFNSCSKDNGTASLIEDKLETMSGKEILRELLIQNDNDINQLARIFGCSSSTLKRIIEGRSIPKINRKNEFKNLLNQTLIAKSYTLDDLDPLNQTWYKKTYLLLKNNIGTIAICYLLFFLISVFFNLTDIALRIFLYSLYIIIIFFIILTIANFFSNETISTDNFIYNLDPIWENPTLN